MLLKCEECGEEEQFYLLQNGTKVYDADRNGNARGPSVDFEPVGSPWYVCGTCNYEYVNDDHEPPY